MTRCDDGKIVLVFWSKLFDHLDVCRRGLPGQDILYDDAVLADVLQALASRKQ